MNTLTKIDVYSVLGESGKTIDELLKGLRRRFKGASRMGIRICLKELEEEGMAAFKPRNYEPSISPRPEERSPERELEYFLTQEGVNKRGVYDSLANARLQRKRANSVHVTRHY